jgi:hypothetical protein
MRKPVQGSPFPTGDEARQWMAFGLSEGAARTMANQRAADALAIMEACEAREAAIRAALQPKRKLLGLF